MGSIGADREQKVDLFHTAARRGRVKPGRLRFESVYPLGIIKTWTWVDLDFEADVYPLPLEIDVPMSGGDVVQSQVSSRPSREDIKDFRPTQLGDSPRDIMWKAYARSDNLLTKTYEEPASAGLWLDWDSLPDLDRETRLSALAAQAFNYSQQGVRFGLRLPGVDIEIDQGSAHCQQVLSTLARFEAEVYLI